MRIRFFLRLILVLVINYYFLNISLMSNCYIADNEIFTLDSNNSDMLNLYEISESDLALTSSNNELYEYEKLVVRGFLGWNDASQSIHPAQSFKVRIWSEGLLYNKLIDSTITDEDGNFEFEITRYAEINMYIEVYPETEKVVINNKDSFLTKIEISNNDIINDIISLNIVFDAGDIRNGAYSIVQALDYSSKYVNDMAGQYLPQVVVDYPASVSTGTCYNSFSKKISLLAGDEFDWDVIMHEYGHYVADMLSFDNDIGGDHFFEGILTDDLNNKFDGIRMAWNEGWATYFALSCQKYYLLNELNVINNFGYNAIGDNNYDDILVGDLIVDNVKFRRMGEGNEHTIAGLLLCLADVDEETFFDNFSYGYKDVWDLIVDNRLTCMSDFCQHLYAVHSFDFSKIGELLTYFEIAVDLSMHTPNSYTFDDYTFSWVIFNSDSKFCLDKFVLKIYDKYKQSCYTIDNILTSYYKPSIEEWEHILQGNGNFFYWAVESYSTKDYITGPYISEFSRVNKPDIYVLNQASYGFEQQYFFYKKNKEILVGDLVINTSRLRTGYIEDEYIVLSPRRCDAGLAYLEYDFNKNIHALSVDLSFWSSNEAINKYNGTCFMQYKNENGEWITYADFLNDYLISKNRNSPTHFYFVFDESINEIRFITTAIPDGDRNKGRLCIGNISFYV